MINYFFKTYGCQANVADSQGISQFLDAFGCVEVQSEDQADLAIVNTCAVRDKAEQKLFSYLGELADHKKARPYMKIGVIGCVASYKKKEIYDRFDCVGFVYGAREEYDLLKAYLTDIITSIETTKQLYISSPESGARSAGQDRDVKKVVHLKGLLSSPRLTPFGIKKSVQKRGPDRPGSDKPLELNRSFVNIMTGCNKACAYCIVPFTRGGEVSYPMAKILDRVTHDIANGAKEITLIGQNVNSYVDPESGYKFPELMRRVASIDGEFWVRWISPHPQDMTRDLFEVIAQYREKLAGYIHFPVQSGSNRILKLMKRNHTVEQYLEQIGWIRELLPGATISTDIIVGFPGETEDDYLATRDLMEKVRYDLIYSFIYSPRKYTMASNMEDNCSYEEKQKRLSFLQERQKEICFDKNSYNIGKILKCLVEKRIATDKLLARTEGNVRVHISGPDEIIGTFVDVNIVETDPVNMTGTLVGPKIVLEHESGGIAKW